MFILSYGLYASWDLGLYDVWDLGLFSIFFSSFIEA